MPIFILPLVLILNSFGQSKNVNIASAENLMHSASNEWDDWKLSLGQRNENYVTSLYLSEEFRLCSRYHESTALNFKASRSQQEYDEDRKNCMFLRREISRFKKFNQRQSIAKRRSKFLGSDANDACVKVNINGLEFLVDSADDPDILSIYFAEFFNVTADQSDTQSLKKYLQDIIPKRGKSAAQCCLASSRRNNFLYHRLNYTQVSFEISIPLSYVECVKSFSSTRRPLQEFEFRKPHGTTCKFANLFLHNNIWYFIYGKIELMHQLQDILMNPFFSRKFDIRFIFSEDFKILVHNTHSLHTVKNMKVKFKL